MAPAGGARFEALQQTLFAVRTGAPPVTFVGLTFLASTSTGAVIDVDGGDLVSFDGCVFEGNTLALRVASGTVAVRNSTFRANGMLTAEGGAIRAEGTSSILIDSTLFGGNLAGEGGAIHASGSASLTISRTNFTANNASRGGAVSVLGSAVMVLRDQTRLHSNSARESASTLRIDGAARVVYVLPAPLGHWIASTVVCDDAAAAVDSLCLSNHGVQSGQHFAALPRGDLDDYPFTCNAGLVGTRSSRHRGAS